jgi:hypothetical protein
LFSQEMFISTENRRIRSGLSRALSILLKYLLRVPALFSLLS